MSIYEYSNPDIAFNKAREYLGKDVNISISDKPKKKYMILNPHTNKYVYFGQIGYKDHTFTNDDKKRELYLKRSANIKGNWRDDKFSPNNLSRNILW